MEVLRERYKLGELIGAGGAAKVYRADDAALERTVAIKLLDDDIARTADPTTRDRFLQEAKLGARVQHPNLVTMFDAGEEDGVLFLVMEYVDGPTLADRIAEDAPLPVDEAVSIACQILDGLAVLHASGTIHRDIKPSNVLFGSDGCVRLADFGIAKRLDELEASVTAVGTLVGTPHYLAPEQATGRPQSPATDVYQVGLVLHEMLTGHRVGGSNPAEAARADAADPRDIRPELPDHVADVVTRATQRDPDRRFASASAMREALDNGRSSTTPFGTFQPLPAGRTRTMPLNVATTAFTGSQPTSPETAILGANPDDSAGGPVRLSGGAGRSLLTAAAMIAVISVLGVLAALFFADGGTNPVLGVNDTSTPSATSPAAPTTAPPMVGPATTLPATTPPTTAAPVTEPATAAQPARHDKNDDDDKPGKGAGRDKDDD